MTKLKCHVCGEEWGTCKHTKYFDGTMEDAEKIMRRLATKCYEFTKQIQSQAKLITQLGEALKWAINAYCGLSKSGETVVMDDEYKAMAESGKSALSAYESWRGKTNG